MFNIGDFLTKFKNLNHPDKIIRDVFIKVILKILKIEINKENIILKKDIVYIKTNPILKNEIFLNKNIILKEVKKHLGKKTPKNII